MDRTSVHLNRLVIEKVSTFKVIEKVSTFHLYEFTAFKVKFYCFWGCNVIDFHRILNLLHLGE